MAGGNSQEGCRDPEFERETGVDSDAHKRHAAVREQLVRVQKELEECQRDRIAACSQLENEKSNRTLQVRTLRSQLERAVGERNGLRQQLWRLHKREDEPSDIDSEEMEERFALSYDFTEMQANSRAVERARQRIHDSVLYAQNIPLTAPADDGRPAEDTEGDPTDVVGTASPITPPATWTAPQRRANVVRIAERPQG